MADLDVDGVLDAILESSDGGAVFVRYCGDEITAHAKDVTIDLHKLAHHLNERRKP